MKIPTERKIKKRRWDSILIGSLMAISFVVLVLRYSGYLMGPCEIINATNIDSIVSCSRSPEENMATIYASIQQGADWVANLTR